MISTIANTIRGLAADMVEKANSGHPGLPLGVAEMAAVLYSEILRHDPAVPDWADRDRFILSAGHGSALLYSLLHLTGDLPIENWSVSATGVEDRGHPETAPPESKPPPGRWNKGLQCRRNGFGRKNAGRPFQPSRL